MLGEQEMKEARDCPGETIHNAQIECDGRQGREVDYKRQYTDREDSEIVAFGFRQMTKNDEDAVLSEREEFIPGVCEALQGCLKRRQFKYECDCENGEKGFEDEPK